MNFATVTVVDFVRLEAQIAMKHLVIIEKYDDREMDIDVESRSRARAPKLNMPTSAAAAAANQSVPVVTVKEVMETRQFRLKRRRTIPKALDLDLEFKNLTYTVHRSAQRSCKCFIGCGVSPAHGGTGRTVLLHDISGAVSAGEILGVMGPSGSGKSTLIDAVAQRIAHESLQGSITLNGEEVKDNVSLMRSISAYVMQDDLLFPMLTVKETLRFAAELRLRTSAFDKNTRVNEVIKQLNLSKVEDSIIGDEGRRGLSGGERRRVSIGKEIVHDPLLLFLDEPTSGLDSANAFTVVETLLRVAATGSIVMLSIHQPSDRLLKMFTKLLLIADGRAIYFGPPPGLKDFFGSIGYDFGDGDVTEPVLDLMQEFHQSGTSVSGLVDEFKNYTAKFQEKKNEASSSFEADPESLLRPTGVRGALAASFVRGKLTGTTSYCRQYDDMDTLVRKFANSRLREVYVLAWRGYLNLKRNPDLFILRWITVFVSSFFLATIFWQLDHSPLGLKERLGFFTFAISTTYYTCADTLPVFLQERYIFMRETAHDSYRISSYVLAIALINIPYLLLLAITFCVVTFWSVGLHGGAPEFLFYLAVIWAAFWAGNSFATFLSAVVTNVIMGYSIIMAFLAYFLLLSGFFITRARIPDYWIWLHYISVMKYPYESVLMNEFSGTDSACYETANQIFYGTPFAGMKNVTSSVLRTLRPLLKGTNFANLKGSTCMINGPAVLRSQSIGLLTKWECLAITVCLGIFYRLLFYVVLRVSGKPKRH